MSLINQTASVDPTATVGAGTHIWHFVHVMRGARIGARCVLGQGVHIGPDVKVGDGCRIQNHVSLYEGVTLEDNVFLGPSCVFTNVKHPRAHVSRKHVFARTHVERGATVGANATIVCGVRIGRYAMIGAGAVVTKDVAPYSLMIGAPAHWAGWACECGETLPAVDTLLQTACSCGAAYRLLAGGGLERLPV